MKRVITYVDGQNLYYGLRAKYGRRYHWLDLVALATSLCPRAISWWSCSTSRHGFATVQPAKPDSTHTWVPSRRRSPTLRIIEGRFQERNEVCRTCGDRRTTYEEKETDVNLATAIVRDAALNRFDTAIMVSADGDLVPAIRTARALRPTTRYYVALPPQRRSGGLRRVADVMYTIGDAKIRAAQFPERVVLPNGTVLERPAYWRQ